MMDDLDLLDQPEGAGLLQSAYKAKDLEELTHTVRRVANRVSERQAEEARRSLSRARQAEELAQAAAEEQDAARAAAACVKAAAGERGAQLQGMRAALQGELQHEDAAGAGPEPPSFMPVIQPVQAPPLAQLQNVPYLSALVTHHHQLLHGSPGAPREQAQALAAAAFAWALRQPARLAACPGEDMARAVWEAVCFGAPALAAAGLEQLLAWAGLPRCAAPQDVAPAAQGPAARSAAEAAAGDALQGLRLCDEQPAAAPMPWLPSAADFLQALTAMGAVQQPASAAGPGPGPGAAYHDANLPLLLKLLASLCRASSAGTLALRAWAPDATRSLLLALLALQLDARALARCRACLLTEAFAALLELPGAREWGRLAPALVDALAGGLGPSQRSSIRLLSQLPRSARGLVLRQQGALLLISRTVQDKQAKPARRCEAKLDARDLVALLQPEPAGVVHRLLPPGVNGAAPSIDTWALTDVLDAADLLLWADVSEPAAGLDDGVRSWFVSWVVQLEGELNKRTSKASVLTTSRVRMRLSELRNAYAFAQHLRERTRTAGDEAMFADFVAASQEEA